MTGDAELLTEDPRWYNFLLGTSTLNFIFTGVDATGAVSRDVFNFKEGPKFIVLHQGHLDGGGGVMEEKITGKKFF